MLESGRHFGFGQRGRRTDIAPLCEREHLLQHRQIGV